MTDQKVILKKGKYRILEIRDIYYNLDDLKGDCFKPEVNPDADLAQLKKQELAFDRLVENEGVFGYRLEKWLPDVDMGWTSIDSCWGFVGRFDESEEKFNHYIVDEFKQRIEEA